MTEYTSIRVTQEAKDAAESSKRESETWNEFLQRCTDNPPEIREFVNAAEVAQQLGPEISEAVWESLDADSLAQQTAAYVGQSDVSLEASERRAIAQEVAEVLQR